MRLDAAPLRRRVWGVLLTLLLPGLGQIYAGAWRLGYGIILVGLALRAVLRTASLALPPTPVTMLLVFAIGLLGTLTLYGGVGVDAWRRLRVPSVPGRRGPRSTWLAVVFGIGGHVAIGAALWPVIRMAAVSMAPALLQGDTVAVWRSDTPARGEFIVFNASRLREPYIKRVIGLPGDRIAIVGGNVVLNGTPLRRRVEGDRVIESLPGGVDYTIDAAATGNAANDIAETVLPRDRYYVLGDARNNSLDSRFAAMGLIARDDLIGVASTIVWSSRPERRFTAVR